MYIVLTVVLALLTALVIIFEILTAHEGRTQLELTLFNVLEFLLALGFAWLLSRATTKKEFEASQKKFALAAYRRILEIDESVERLLTQTRNQIMSASPEICHELELVVAIASGIRQTTKSSIADWGEIIGEEIEIFQRVENLKAEGELLRAPSETADSQPTATDGLLERMEEHQSELRTLVQSLPRSLRLLSKSDRSDSVESVIAELAEEEAREGHVELPGFWNISFERPLSDFQVGDKFEAFADDLDNRVGALFLHDDDGKIVGLITNSKRCQYHDLVRSLSRYLRRSRFRVELVSLSEKAPHKRGSFVVKIVDLT